MDEDIRLACRYRILRYVPNLVRDEWVNVGVLLEQMAEGGAVQTRVALRFIEENAEFARVRRIHPEIDEDLLRSLPAEMEKGFRGATADVAAYLGKLDQTLSNILQFGPGKLVMTDDFHAELDRLYTDQVSPPAHKGRSVVQSGLDWIRIRLTDIFRRHRVLSRLERDVPVSQFTFPGDPMKLDYAYQNGARGFVHAVSLKRDLARAKALAYTAERVRKKAGNVEFTAMTEIEPLKGNETHEFVLQLFADQGIAIVPLSRAERFAEDLRIRLS
jgi:DUF3037 family protein